MLTPRSEEHTSELQSRQYLHSFPTRRSSDLGCFSEGRGEGPGLYIDNLPEPAESLVDQLTVDVDAVCLDDRTGMLAVVGSAARDGQVDASAFGQSGGQVVVPLPQLGVGKSCSFSSSHGVLAAQSIGYE